jgi:hypothetical protein
MSAQVLQRQPSVAPPTRPRELGIYTLHGGGEFVASTLYTGGCSLYPTRGWGRYGAAEYRIDVHGRLWRHGEPTRLRVGDLSDTGRTAKYPAPLIR